MLSFQKLEEKLVAGRIDSGTEENDSSKREMARLNEKISELSTNLEEMQYALGNDSKAFLLQFNPCRQSDKLVARFIFAKNGGA